MLKKYVSKFAMDILPSVAATIIGAYIVNHYIVTKPAANTPAVAAVSTAEPQAGAKVAPEAAKAGSQPPETSSDVANIPEAGVKAKGISEKAMIEKTAAEKPAAVEKPAEKAADKAEKPADKPAETASIAAGTRHHPPAPREKAIAKAVPAPLQPPVPLVAAPATVPAPAVEAMAPEEHRDANDLARAAIERLRSANEPSPRTQEAARIPDASRVPDGPRVPEPPRIASATPVRPLPPPIIVSTPPADIPTASPPLPPLDLHAEAEEPLRRGHTTVAEDVLSAAKSVFHAVLPKKLTD